MTTTSMILAAEAIAAADATIRKALNFTSNDLPTVALRLMSAASTAAAYLHAAEPRIPHADLTQLNAYRDRLTSGIATAVLALDERIPDHAAAVAALRVAMGIVVDGLQGLRVVRKIGMLT